MGNDINWGKLLFRAGLIYAGAKLLDEVLSNDSDTVNYILKYRGKIVYHGICYEDRLDARLCEHKRNGIKFDECIFSEAKTRTKAGGLERKRIRRDRPKYNFHHKY